MVSGERTVFPIVVFDATDGWGTVMQLAKPLLDTRGLERLQFVLGSHCQAVVLERHYIDKDYRDTFSNFHSKRFNTPSSRCLRLHFFSAAVSESSIAAGEAEALDAYLGYSVIRPTRPNCVGRTLITQKLRLEQSAHLSVCSECVSLLGRCLEVTGFPFISQDTDATVCAESALWMLFRYFSNRYPAYSEIRPFEITNLASRHAIGHRVYPSGGLYSWQLAEAMRLRDFAPMVYSRQQFQGNFEHLLYTYIESGLPLLITVPEHVVTAFGHLSDYSSNICTCGAGASYRYTSEFNEAFIVNDDNCFPYQRMLRSSPAEPRDSRFNWANIREFIVPLPERVFLPAEQVQTAMEEVLKKDETGVHLSPQLSAAPHVRRLFLTTARSFKGSLHERGMGSQIVERVYRQLPMPHFIWVCEFAEVSEYCQDRKILGEMIWDATLNAHEPDGWIVLHYPEKLFFDRGSSLNGVQQIEEVELTDGSSYPLYESNLHSLTEPM